MISLSKIKGPIFVLEFQGKIRINYSNFNIIGSWYHRGILLRVVSQLKCCN